MKIKKIIKIFPLCFLLIALCLTPLASALEETAADSLEEKGHGWVYFPIIFYSPETKTGFGAGVGYFFRTPGSTADSRPSAVLSNLIYTQRKQIIIGLLTDIYLRDEAYYLSGELGYREFPDKFYGIGNRTSWDAEENYTPEGLQILLKLQARLLPGLYFGPLYEVYYSRLNEIDVNGLLATGRIPGNEEFSLSCVGAQINWDTRDHVYCPSSGGYHQLSVSSFSDALGGDYNFKRYLLDLRQYVSLSGDHVLAFQAYGRSTNGDVPFQLLSPLGGANMLRGYYEGRYRDHDMLAFQAEYRSPYWRRFGLAAFAAAGDVVGKMSKLRLGDFKTSGGFGVRYLFVPKEKLTLRFDFGFAKNTSGFYINFMEAF